jgi:prepilin-type N-terminal cleavage/methylation domain-containing protein
MKNPRLSKPKPASVLGCRRARGFTLPEMMVAVSIFVFMTLGIIYTMLFGMRWDELVCSKLGASDKSRLSFDLLTGEIRAAKSWSIGNIGNNDKTSFTPCGNATAQLGNALSLTNSAGTTSWVRYWFDTNNCWLCRGTNNGVATSYQIITQNLTNTGLTGLSMAFHAEKRFNANLVTSITTNDILQDLEYKYVVATTMEFCQYQYPLTRVGPGYYYNYYCIQIKAASHCPN